MENLNKMYIRKSFDDGDYSESNDVFTLISKKEGYMIFKKYDTLYEEEDFVIIDNERLEKDYISVSDFFNVSSFIGKSGYFEGMQNFEKEIYRTYIVIYASSAHLLIYDTIFENIILTFSSYDVSSFIPFDEQYDVVFNDISFSRKRNK